MSSDDKTNPGVEPVELPDLVAQAAEDPCMPIRNLAGHFIMCNFGDWVDFSKCDCEQGIAGAGKEPDAFAVSPMPLRDFFAATINISDDQAVELAAAVKQRRENLTPKELAQAMVGNEPVDLTITEIAEARARLRYLEADVLLNWRTQSARLKAAAIKAKADH
jgi:hypothetical protein